MFSVFVQYLFLLSAYPLARWVLPRIQSRQKALVFHITIGLAACSLLYKTRLVYAFVMIAIGYLILDKNPYTVFCIAFFMNTAVHFIQLCFPVSVRVKNLTKMIFFKIVATSFNLADGKNVNQNKLTKRQKTCQLQKKPTFLEWFGYCITPFGALSPSFYEFRIFEYILDVGKNTQKVSEKSHQKAIDCLKRSFIHFTIYYVFRHYFTLKFYKSEFFLSLNIIFRILYVLVLGIIVFSRDFMFWKVVDASLFAVGIEDSGLLSEDEFSSLTIENLLSKRTIKEWSSAFNHTNELFWKNYLTSRANGSGLSQEIINYIAFVCKPVYKGLCGGFLLGAFEKKLFVAAEKVLHKFAPKYTKTFWPEYIFTQVFMVLNRSSMRFTTTYSFFYVNYVIYFIFWFIAAAMVLADKFLLKQDDSVQNEKKEKEDDQQHVKKD